MRHFSDWLKAYVEYAGFSEAPKRMHFFSGVVAIAGALRRHVWLDMQYFKWHVNHYVILVAPPGVVSKSTTASIAMDILRKIQGPQFGPDVVTWPALVSAFAASAESFELNGEFHTQCALTLESSEFGNLVNPQDREMIDLLVSLWDSKTGAFTKKTKTSGNDSVENPWINMIACTTPSWIAGNMPESVIGGGFTSRCLFVYADKKEKLVPYPHLAVPQGLSDVQRRLAEDLYHIASRLIGPYRISPEAVLWGTEWYKRHDAHPSDALRNDDRFGGYLARKQTHIHKLAMVIAAAQRDDLVIEASDLSVADVMITDLEKDMPEVFAKIGRTEQSIQAERFIKFIQQQGEAIPYTLAYQFAHKHFPDLRDFEGIMQGAISSGQLKIDPRPDGTWVKAVRTQSMENGRTSSVTSPPTSPMSGQLPN